MDSDKIVSHFHENKEISPKEKDTVEYNETEKIFRIRKYVSLLSRVNEHDNLWKRIDKRVNTKSPITTWLKYAAIIVLSFTLGSTLIFLSGISIHDSQIASISSPRGQITSLKLFDGSTVWLNSESTIKYSKAFNKSKREVFIEGEAYFDVTTNKKKPFIVNLGNAKVKVHGTSFNVKAYPESNEIEAALKEGKIEFISNNQSVILAPSEQATFSKNDGTIIKNEVDIKKASSWKKGKYYYSNEKLTTVINQLERWFDTEIIYNNEELSAYQLTGFIDREKSLRYNLRIIELTNKINIEYKNETIIIHGKK